jgi:hypothetical protein
MSVGMNEPGETARAIEALIDAKIKQAKSSTTETLKQFGQPESSMPYHHEIERARNNLVARLTNG